MDFLDNFEGYLYNTVACIVRAHLCAAVWAYKIITGGEINANIQPVS